MFTFTTIVGINLVGACLSYGLLLLFYFLFFPLKESDTPNVVLPVIFWPITIFVLSSIILISGLAFLCLRLNEAAQKGLRVASQKGYSFFEGKRH
jgi:hypothetical protein